MSRAGPGIAPVTASASVLAFAAALACVIGWRPVAYGATAADVVRYLAFVLGWIVAPGCIWARALGLSKGDRLFDLGLGWTLGHVALTLAMLALRWSGATGVIIFFPLIVAALGFAIMRKPKRAAGSAIPHDAPVSNAPRVTFVHVALLLVLCVIAVERSRLLAVENWWSELNADSWFHAGNAAELANHWPMRNPRVASLDFRYHFFSYAPAAAARDVMGLSISDVMLRLSVSTVPVLLVLQVFNAGRMFGGSAAAGLIASSLVVLRADLGLELVRWIGTSAAPLNFNSYLGFGLFRSPTTVVGLLYFVTIAMLLKCLLDREERVSRTHLSVAALLAFCASGSKGSVMPVVLAALAALVVFDLVVQRRLGRRAILALVVMGAASLPMTLYLATGESSYGSAMFRTLPGESMHSAGFFEWLAATCGFVPDDAPAWFSWLVLPFWVCGYFGIIGAGAALHAWRRGRGLDQVDRWLIGCAVLGAAFALSFAALGQTQLHFLFTGEVGFAVLAGAGLATWSGARALRVVLLVVLGLPFLAAGALAIQVEMQRDVEPRAVGSELLDQYKAGLDWMRANVPREAVMITAHEAMLVSVHGERAAFYETDRFTPEEQARGWSHDGRRWTWKRDPSPVFPELDRLRRQFFAVPIQRTARELRAALPADTELYAVFDEVESPRPGTGVTRFTVSRVLPPAREFNAALMSLVFENEAMRIYRVDARGER